MKLFTFQLEDDVEGRYHAADEMKSIEAMKLDKKFVQIFAKQGEIDTEDGKCRITIDMDKILIDTLNKMIEVSEHIK